MKHILVFLNLNRKTGSMPSSISEIIRVVKGQTAQYRRGGRIRQVAFKQMQETLQTLESTKLIERVLDDGYKITKDGIIVAKQILKEAGLEVGRVSYRYNDNRKGGVVLKQEPTEETMVRRGDRREQGQGLHPFTRPAPQLCHMRQRGGGAYRQVEVLSRLEGDGMASRRVHVGSVAEGGSDMG